MQGDPYATLELPWGAPPEAIKRAFRRLARLHHPDRNAGDAQAEARFKLVSAAYQRLKEAGWSLPRPAAATPPRSNEPEADEEEFERPQYWPDGAPIHYPTAEEIEALIRGAGRAIGFPRLEKAALLLAKGTAYIYFFVIAASLVVMAGVLLRACVQGLVD